MITPRCIATALLALLGTVFASPGAARAAAEGDTSDPRVDLRAFAGLGSGLGADLWLARGRARLDAAAQWVPGEALYDLALVAPFAGTARQFLGARIGYELQHTSTDGKAGWRGSEYAQTADAGLVFHAESSAGHTFHADLGVEWAYRDSPAQCCDNAPLRTSSWGARVALLGAYAFTQRWALFAQAGVRTADHLLELRVLPTASVGVRLRL